MTEISKPDFDQYLQPGRFVDSDAPTVVDFAQTVSSGSAEKREKAVSIYYAVRDTIRYDPYNIDLAPEALTASSVLAKGRGFCIVKANLLAAAARVVGIPSRLGYANVRNHLTTERLNQYMRSDVFAFHGFTELYLEGRWVKATPAFNISLCQRFDVKPLEFDGQNDSIFHEYDSQGLRHMEYLQDLGHYADLPRKLMIATFRKHYPHLYDETATTLDGDFEADASSS
jgi:transglutaminase-like putative cysteine protease